MTKDNEFFWRVKKMQKLEKIDCRKKKGGIQVNFFSIKRL
jgi:hypothetical protein